jgi:hypothetical protein
VGVDGGVAGRPRQVLPLSVGDVLPVSLNVPLGQSEVDEKHFMGSFVEPHTKVVGFDVSVDEVPIVNILDPADHLIDEHEHGLQ